MKYFSATVLAGSSIALATGALYVFAMYDMERRLALIDSYQVDIVAKEGEKSSFARLATLVEETEGDRDRVRAHIVSSDGVVLLLKEIESLAGASLADIKIVSVAEKVIAGEDKGRFEEVVIAMTVGGEYSSVRHAIAMLEALPYPSKITQMRLESRKDGKKTVWSTPLMLSVLKDI